MVNLTETRLSNAKLKSYGSGLVAVFVGGTSGLGETAARQFAISADRPKLYLLGRNEAAAKRTIGELSKINNGGIYHFLKVDASLLGNIDAVCEEIKQKENHINLLVLSQGYLSLDWERQETSEGLDVKNALHYYGRMKFIDCLLSLLNRSQSLARVVDIFLAGKEGNIDEKDLELRHNMSPETRRTHCVTMTTLAIEELAIRNPSISFVHLYPGWVKTNLYSSEHFLMPKLINYIIFPTLAIYRMLPFVTPIAVGVGESGERTVFASASARFPPGKPVDSNAAGTELLPGMSIASGTNGYPGSGGYALRWDGEPSGNQKLLQSYRETGTSKRIWEHTLVVFEKVAAGSY